MSSWRTTTNSHPRCSGSINFCFILILFPLNLFTRVFVRILIVFYFVMSLSFVSFYQEVMVRLFAPASWGTGPHSKPFNAKGSYSCARGSFGIISDKSNLPNVGRRIITQHKRTTTFSLTPVLPVLPLFLHPLCIKDSEQSFLSVPPNRRIYSFQWLTRNSYQAEMEATRTFHYFAIPAIWM